jgi:hypothetical protein
MGDGVGTVQACHLVSTAVYSLVVTGSGARDETAALLGPGLTGVGAQLVQQPPVDRYGGEIAVHLDAL